MIYAEIVALRGFFPELAVEIGVECAVDLEERVEVGVTELAMLISHVVSDHPKDLERELRERHRNRMVAERNAS
jgi:hypothetical protein